jgi:hypothetical protein
MLENVPSSGSWGKGTMVAPKKLVLENRQRDEEVYIEC